MKSRYVALSVIIAVAISVGGLFYFKLLTWDDVKKLWSKTSSIASVNSNSPGGYIAVYLTNGKVYFGKIVDVTSDEPVMSDVFFLSSTAASNTSPKIGKEQGAEVVSSPQTEFQLIRLTDQFQSPIDRLTLTRDHILYWEELSDDSKVVQAITKYHENQGK